MRENIAPAAFLGVLVQAVQPVVDGLHDLRAGEQLAQAVDIQAEHGQQGRQVGRVPFVLAETVAEADIAVRQYALHEVEVVDFQRRRRPVFLARQQKMTAVREDDVHMPGPPIVPQDFNALANMKWDILQVDRRPRIRCRHCAGF